VLAPGCQLHEDLHGKVGGVAAAVADMRRFFSPPPPPPPPPRSGLAMTKLPPLAHARTHFFSFFFSGELVSHQHPRVSRKGAAPDPIFNVGNVQRSTLLARLIINERPTLNATSTLKWRPLAPPSQELWRTPKKWLGEVQRRPRGGASSPVSSGAQGSLVEAPGKCLIFSLD